MVVLIFRGILVYESYLIIDTNIYIYLGLDFVLF